MRSLAPLGMMGRWARRSRREVYDNSASAVSSRRLLPLSNCSRASPERDHERPADWSNPDEEAPKRNGLPIVGQEFGVNPLSSTWVNVGKVADFPQEGGVCIKYHEHQVAVFQFATKGQWYATQNMCPHKYDMVLARGITGTEGDTPKVACPQHKKTFSLETGAGLNDPSLRIQTYNVRIDGDIVMVQLPDWMD